MPLGTLILAAALAQTAPITLVESSLSITNVRTHGVPGNGRTPVAGDPSWETALRDQAPDLTDGWTEQTAGDGGQFSGRAFQGTYAYAVLNRVEPEVMLLEAPGSSHVIWNGSPRSGDPYGYGYLAMPVQLRAGENRIWAACGRGSLKLTLKPLPAPVFVESRDMTLPDRITDGELLAGITVVNGTNADLTDYELEVRSQAGTRRTRGETRVPAMSLAKVGVTLSGNEFEYSVRVIRGSNASPWVPISIRKRSAQETYRVTFKSAIDNTVQYFAVRPPVDEVPIDSIILSLHGASVEAQGQADAYGPHRGAVIVAATNRRPYGFDWEEVGRADALEVLRLAREMWPSASHTFLTGHSMGGHGTWSLGGHHPWEFEGIQPCASWRSFFTYGGAPRWPAEEPIGAVLNRAANVHDTFLVKENYSLLPIFVLHGDADTTVPISEPRNMIAELAGHPALESFEEPGQGHWYDTDPAPGANCLDYAPAWKFLMEAGPLGRNAFGNGKPVTIRTMDPTASGGIAGIRIAEVVRFGEVASLTVQKVENGLRVTTENVRSIALDDSIDAATIEQPEGQSVRIVSANDPVGRHRDATRQGYGFKSIWLRPVTIVYGTRGTETERRLMRDGARFLAETFLYRGNGNITTMPDREAKGLTTQVLLIGSPSNNSAFMDYAGSSPLRGGRATVHAGSRTLPGEGLAVVTLSRPTTETGMNAMISAAGEDGLIAALRVPYFTPGAAMPDGMILDASMLESGLDSVKAAGWLGSDWSLANGDWTFRTP
ncbi:MAG: prolyl oligopeptidase family serine peptidase [Fimbriimonadaceae bacterium]|nr:prolyl oligopeptidase family serine peptidase [Fimbriimonadaceae bacterium]